MASDKMLTGHAFFRSLLPEQVERIRGFSSTRTLEKGTTIYNPDRKATHVFVLLEGDVHLLMPGVGDRRGLLVDRVGKGEFFGIAPLLDADRYTTKAQCVKNCKVLFIEAKPLLKVLSEFPAVGRQIMTAVARAYFDRYQSLMERVQRILTDLA